MHAHAAALEAVGLHPYSVREGHGSSGIAFRARPQSPIDITKPFVSYRAQQGDRYPLLALDLIWEHIVGDTLVFQSLTRGSRDVLTLDGDDPFYVI